jgi:uncharacterized protein (DUF433 family)
MSLTYITKRITVNPKQGGGKPCIRGMRIRVVDVLDLLANGLTLDEVLSEFPKLEREDVLASIKYAREQMDHAVLSSEPLIYYQIPCTIFHKKDNCPSSKAA